MLKALIAPFLPYLYGAAALGAVALGLWAYNSIYDRGYQAASTVYERKALDQKAANDLAIQQAEDKLRGSIRMLIQEKEKLEDDYARLSSEAAQDPDAANGGIGVGSVQRINSVR